MKELEKILQEIEKAKNEYPCACFPWYLTGLSEAEKIIRKHMKDCWIPVEDRLPEEKEWRGYDEEKHCAYMKRMEVTYMTDTLEYAFGYFDGYKWMDKRYDIIKNVVAWKPHEPYIPKSKDN